MRRIEAHEVPLDEVFSNRYAFRIPDYQRPYAWHRDHAEQLLDDLAETVEAGTDEPYFLGSIVLVKEADEAEADVIDGQQRLTTLTILLAVLRDLAGDPELRAELDQRIVEPGSKMRRLEREPRVRLRERDQAFFQRHVQTQGATDTIAELDPAQLPTDAQRAVRENTAALRGKLATWPDARRLALAQVLAGRTFLVVVSTPDLSSAHRIFSVMNARGLDLSPADLVKSLVIGGVGEAGGDQAAYADRWEEAEEALGRDDFADLFLHIRTIFAQERARKELLREFRAQVLARFLPDRPAAFVDDVLVPYATAYQQLRDCDFVASSGADEVNRWLRRLHGIDDNDWRPPALWALQHHRDDPAWIAAFLRRLERLAASMLIRRVYASPRATRYANLLKALERGEGLEAAPLRLAFSERADTLGRLRGDVYRVAPVRRFVLLRLDDLLADDAGATYDHRVVTVEHVLPQRPARDSHWLTDFTPEQRTYWTHRLANLVLLNRRRNSAAQNYAFDRKKELYFRSRDGVSAFALTTQVLAEPAWTPEVLARRQERLVELLAREWQL